MTNESEIIRQAMSLIGQRKTEKKTAASRRTIQQATAHRVSTQTLLPCTCGAVGEEPHKSKCPVYQREYKREHKQARKGEGR